MAVGIAGGPAFTEFDRAPAERHERRPVRMRGHIILGDGAHHEIHLLDLSYEGCGIETAATLEPGQALKLSVLRRGAMDAVVRWTRGDKAGLAFVPDAAEAKKRWPRRSERVALSAEVTLRRLGHTNFRVTVSDASPEGCKVELVERPAEGESVIVKFEGLEALEAQVCWIGGYTAGLKYARPMHPAVFDLLVERLA
jgi:hypothetical protein